MLVKVSNPEVMKIYDAREKYRGSKAVFIVTDSSNMSEMEGYVCVLSKDNSSYSKLCEYNAKLKSEGKQTVIIGSYENGGSVGVQYEVFR